MIYIWFYLTVFLFTWYSAKLLKNKMIDQYWHIPQVIFLFAVYSLGFFINYDWKYLITMFLLGLQFPFLFNVGLNAYRRKEIGDNWVTYLGKYDKLTFAQTVHLLIIGVAGSIIWGLL